MRNSYPSESLLGQIGNTPLVELKHLSPKKGVRIFAKLEGGNPSGSIKDRIVLSMIESAEENGSLNPGDTIVEASTGNTAIALAFVAKQKGYMVKVVLPRGVVPSMADVLELYGAKFEWCEPSAGMRGAIEIAKNLATEDGVHELGQFTHEANVQTHYDHTGVEVLEKIGDIAVFIAGIGTGGTITGVSRRLRERDVNVRVIGVEPKLGDKLQGLRSLAEGYIPPLLDFDALDGRYLVDSASAIVTARRVVEAEGILVGVSSGAALAGALRAAERIDKGNIVVMFSDGGWKYLPSRPWDAAGKSDERLDEVHWW